MTMLMDNDKENPTSDHVKFLFNKNVELQNKLRKAAQARISSDPNTWQNMRENYETIILEDHGFSEKHDVEYALWQLHYRRIEELRALFNASVASAGSQNEEGPVRAGPNRITKIRSQFKTFLSEATGFYHDLMLKIRAKYGLPLGYFSDDQDNQIQMSKDGNKSSSEMKKGLVSCHRCLIYLGDLGRYKSLYGDGDTKFRDFTAASSYYIQASSIWPSGGNPHNQLAILAGYSNDELLSIYRYFRSLALDNPFVTARDNLTIAFEKNRLNYIQLLGDAKTVTMKTTTRVPAKVRGKGETRHSSKDNRVEVDAVKEKTLNNLDLVKAFVTRFIRLNGILFTRTSLETFAEVFSMAKSDLLKLLSSGPHEEVNFGSDVGECRLTVVRIVAVLIFTVHNVSRENENKSYADILQRSVLLQNAFTSVFELMGCILERCNQLTEPSVSYLLPGIMVFVEWLACHADVAVGTEMEEKQVNARSFFWNRCISFLNKLLSGGHVFINKDEDETFFSNMSKYDEMDTCNRVALAEDFELRGFLPLVPAHMILDFSRKGPFGGDGGSKERRARIERIIAAGKALANVVRSGREGVYFDGREKRFMFGVEPKSSDDYLLESCLDMSMGGHLSSNTEVGVGDEDDDEDEVILFKPPATEEHMDEFTSNLTSGIPFPSVGFGDIDSRHERWSVSNGTPQYLQPVQPNMLNWPVEHAPIMNGLTHLNLEENGHFLKQEPQQDAFRVSQPASFSMPYPQFVSTGNSQSYAVQIPQAAVQSRFDSVFSSGVSVDSLSLNGLSVRPSSIMPPPGSKKNPVGRPIRHFGPPPGFGSFPSKAADETLVNNIALRNRSPPVPQMDDYSWMDGYNPLSSSKIQSVGFSNSMNHMGPAAALPSVGPMEIGRFPFLGKQVSMAQDHSEKPKGRQDYHFAAGHVKQYEEQQHLQFLGENQLPSGAPQQYQGQSIWEGRFFV